MSPRCVVFLKQEIIACIINSRYNTLCLHIQHAVLNTNYYSHDLSPFHPFLDRPRHKTHYIQVTLTGAVITNLLLLVLFFMLTCMNIILIDKASELIFVYSYHLNLSKGPFTQVIFVAATQCNFCRAEVATSKSHV